MVPGRDWNSVVKLGVVKVVVGRRKTYRPEDIDCSKAIPDGPLAHVYSKGRAEAWEEIHDYPDDDQPAELFNLF